MKTKQTIADILGMSASELVDLQGAYEILSDKWGLLPGVLTAREIVCSPFIGVPLHSVVFAPKSEITLRFCLDDLTYPYNRREVMDYITKMLLHQMVPDLSFEAVQLKLWRYSFGCENVTVGIIWAEDKEDAQNKLIAAYGFNPASVNIRSFGSQDATRHPDVLEVVDL